MSTLPATVIGGYLGAGKTTLINHLLRHANGRRLAVLVNEFGELAIDEDLIEVEDDNLISISGGCICCSFGDNLISTVTKLASLNPRPDHIVIEASGVAIPASIAANLSLLPGIALNGVIVVADCSSVEKAAANDYVGDTIFRQLQSSDLVIATKSDLCSQEDVAQVCDWLARVAKGVRVVPTRQGGVPPDLVLGPVGIGHSHTATPHSDALFESHVFNLDHPLDVSGLSQALLRPSMGLVRAKGFVRDVSGQTFLLQLVGRRVDVAEAEPAQRHALVCIALSGQLDRSSLNELFYRTNWYHVDEESANKLGVMR